MEFQLNEKTYRVGKIDARKQFHIVRRLAPVLGELVPAVRSGGSADSVAAIASAVSKLSDADADYCIFGLLGAVVRKQDNGLGWGPVSTGESLMYDDITMPIMLQLAWKAMSFNMSGFFAALPSDLKEAAQRASAQ